MITQTFIVGKLSTNCYIVTCQKTCETIIVDPGFDFNLEAERVFKFIKEKALKPVFTLNTHGHPDHTCGNRLVKEKFSTPILIHEKDAFMLGESGKALAKFSGFKTYSPEPDKLLHDGDTIKFGNETLKVMHTPGHSPGSISLVGEKEVFTGDTLFAGSIGRTDLPQSSEKDMLGSLRKLLSLPDSFVVYPGHGPETTIGEEKAVNPFLQRLEGFTSHRLKGRH